MNKVAKFLLRLLDPKAEERKAARLVQFGRPGEIIFHTRQCSRYRHDTDYCDCGADHALWKPRA